MRALIGAARPIRHLTGSLLTLMLLLAACGSDDSAESDSDGTRDDVPCDLESLPTDDATEFLVVHYVVDGELGAVCHGEEDPTLYSAWDELTVFTPPGQLNDLSLFAGFSYQSSDDTDTLAFVNVVDDEGSTFQMSINLDAYDADPNEATLTLAHEFSHVFTSTSSQLDRSVLSAEECDTYFNAEGCFLPDAVMSQWIDLFWGDGLIEEIDVNAEPDPADGEGRCALDSSFLGPYAASNPEEDFAETFSAFVFRVGPVADEVQAKFDWLADQPGLVEFRDRAEQADLGPLENNFEPCGG